LIDLEFKFKDLLSVLKKEKPFNPEIAIILGSGLGEFSKNIPVIKTISTSSLPGFPPSTIPGHSGKIHFADYSGKKVLLFEGRIHFYEGYSIDECILPVLVSYKSGCRNIIITNAAGGINPFFKPGDLMIASSINSFSIKKELTELVGLAAYNGKQKFSNLPSAKLNQLIEEAALKEKIMMKYGVYWYTKGPSYETPAEIKMIKSFGGDAVGMSTTHEAVLSAYFGMETAVISCITNYAAGITNKKLSHSEVTETANLVKGKFEKLIKRILMLL
jgi:purine-nucleoside phosphorylase